MSLTVPKDRHNARVLVVSVGGASVVIVGLLYTAVGYRLTRRGQVTDRFTKALERLGSNEPYVRYGGILALEQIVQDAPDQAAHATEVLTAFVRIRAALLATVSPASPEEDVQAALTALTRPRLRRRLPRSVIINLSGLHLAHAQLSGADLTRASLDRAILTRAQLSGADLTGASLRQATLSAAQLSGADLTNAALTSANLIGTWLNRADLTGASLDGAQCGGAAFTGADLTRSRLNGAKLTQAVGLTVHQVVSARPTRTTELPPPIAEDPVVKARIRQVESDPAE